MSIITLPKSTEAIFYDINLNPAVLNTANRSFQEKYYTHKNHTIVNNKDSVDYYLTNITPDPCDPESIYSFVVIEENQQLKLIIGKANHHIIAKNAPSVKAAGDIYVWNNTGKIFKLTDRSGGYYIPNTDPLAEAKKASAQEAMKSVGLPMHLFVPFNPRPVIFSHKLYATNNRDISKEEISSYSIPLQDKKLKTIQSL